MRLRLALDLGTKALKMAYNIAEPDDKIELSRIHPIYYDFKGPEAPMIIGYHGEKFVWGYDAKALIDAGCLGESNYISLLKLALYSDPDTEPIHQETRNKLKQMRKSLEEVLEQCISVFTTYARDNIKNHSHGYEIDTLPIDLFISVPQMWTPVANRKMVLAAKNANVGSVRLVYEPECAAAFVIAQELMTQTNGPITDWLSADDVILVADIGGGTAVCFPFFLTALPSRRLIRI